MEDGDAEVPVDNNDAPPYSDGTKPAKTRGCCGSGKISTTVKKSLHENPYDRPSPKSVKRAKNWLKRVKIVASVAIGLELVLAIFVVIAPPILDATDGEHEDMTAFEDTEYVDMQMVVMQFIAALAILLFVAIAFVVVLFPIKEDYSTSRWNAILFLQVACLLLDAITLASPRHATLYVIWFGAAFRVVIIALISLLRYFSLVLQREKLINEVSETYGNKLSDFCVEFLHKKTDGVDCDDHDFVLPLQTYERHMELCAMRSKFRKKMLRASSQMVIIYFLIVLIFGYGCFFELFKTLSFRGEAFDIAQFDRMNDVDKVTQRFGDTRTTTTQKAVVVVLDGLHLGGLENADLKGFIDGLGDDAVSYRMLTQLPTMSVPNWLTTITGVTPEMSGVWGNLMVPETHSDSIYRQAKNFKLHRGISASPWFSMLIKSQLPVLDGDGTVAFTYDVTDGTPSARDADRKRADVLLKALRKTEDPYQFFLAHFSDIDLQGHALGVEKKYNKDNTYYRALKEKVGLLEEIKQQLDENTLLVILSDHGIEARGGHGGAAKEVIEAPLVFYQKNSKLKAGKRVNRYPGFDVDKVENLDVSPTLCAILGLPVPRQNQGLFIDYVMSLAPQAPEKRLLHFKDLFFQKREFVKEFVRVMNLPEALNGKAVFEANYENRTEIEYRDGVLDIMEEFHHQRSHAMEIRVLRNALVTGLMGVCILMYALYTIHSRSFADPTRLIRFMTCSSLPYWSADLKAFLWSFISLVLYYSFSIGMFKLLYMAYGYDIWDSTFLHFPPSFVVYSMFVFVPSSVMAFIIIRVYHFAIVLPPLKDDNMNKWRWRLWVQPWYYLRCIFTIRHCRKGDTAFLYLMKHYMMLICILGIVIMWILSSAYTCILPPMFFIRLINSFQWTYRFRLITLQLITVPLILGVLVNFPSWCDDEVSVKQPIYDPIYLLWIDKILSQMTRGDETPGLLKLRRMKLVLEESRIMEALRNKVRHPVEVFTLDEESIRNLPPLDPHGDEGLGAGKGGVRENASMAVNADYGRGNPEYDLDDETGEKTRLLG